MTWLTADSTNEVGIPCGPTTIKAAATMRSSPNVLFEVRLTELVSGATADRELAGDRVGLVHVEITADEAPP